MDAWLDLGVGGQDCAADLSDHIHKDTGWKPISRAAGRSGDGLMSAMEPTDSIGNLNFQLLLFFYFFFFCFFRKDAALP